MRKNHKKSYQEVILIHKLQFLTHDYSDVSNNRTGTAIYFQKEILPIRFYVFQRLWNTFNLYAYPFWKICHPVLSFKTIRLLEISEYSDNFIQHLVLLNSMKSEK